MSVEYRTIPVPVDLHKRLSRLRKERETWAEFITRVVKDLQEPEEEDPVPPWDWWRDLKAKVPEFEIHQAMAEDNFDSYGKAKAHLEHQAWLLRRRWGCFGLEYMPPDDLRFLRGQEPDRFATLLAKCDEDVRDAIESVLAEPDTPDEGES